MFADLGAAAPDPTAPDLLLDSKPWTRSLCHSVHPAREPGRPGLLWKERSSSKLPPPEAVLERSIARWRRAPRTETELLFPRVICKDVLIRPGPDLLAAAPDTRETARRVLGRTTMSAAAAASPPSPSWPTSLSSESEYCHKASNATCEPGSLFNQLNVDVPGPAQASAHPQPELLYACGQRPSTSRPYASIPAQRPTIERVASSFRTKSDREALELTKVSLLQSGPSSSSSPSSTTPVVPPEPASSQPTLQLSFAHTDQRRNMSPPNAGWPRGPDPATLAAAAAAATAAGLAKRQILTAAPPTSKPPLLRPNAPHLPPTSSSSSSSSARPSSTVAPGRDQDRSLFISPDDLATLVGSDEPFLLLDVRVQQQFMGAHVVHALNLCIPTTLLKRPSYDVQKLAATFTDPKRRAQFERWRTSSCIVAYDERSSSEKEAAMCLSTLKKFSNETWQGRACILQGGFASFASRFPDLVTGGGASDPTKKAMASSSTSSSSSSSATSPSQRGSFKASGPVTAPVLGGLVMPSGQTGANPFFGNIRQNVDLVDGVGQIPIRRPADISQERETSLPRWLSAAAEPSDRGKLVAQSFLRIEKAEQRRMQEVLSGAVVPVKTASAERSLTVRLAGIEEGSKNRYNNIWPFEHARVKLQGRRDGAGDYINASYVKAPWSNKRYIATQGPLPATVEDFWQLVWEEDVRVIVMLTAEHEGGQLKCHSYWTGRELGPLQLKSVSERKVSLEPGRHGSSGTPSPSTATAHPVHTVVRTFSLTHTAHPFVPMREITQIQLDSWLDFDVPANPAYVLNVIEQTEAVVQPPLSPGPHQQGQPFPTQSRSVLVHCSAGCGRTGTFCTIASVLDMLRRQRAERLRRGESFVVGGGRGGRGNSRSGTPASDMNPSPPPLETDMPSVAVAQDDLKAHSDWLYRDDVDLIATTVEQLRGQRISMVQCLRQYVLCYEAVLEWLVRYAPPMPPPPRPRLAPVGSSSTTASTSSRGSSVSSHFSLPPYSSPPPSTPSAASWGKNPKGPPTRQ